MSFLFGRKKTQELSNFERRQSMAQKLEMEERQRAASAGVAFEEARPDATQFIGASIGEVVKGQTKKSSMIVQQQQRKGTARKTDLPPPPPLIEMRTPADESYIEFTIVPLLLRANVSYDEANTYGESLKSCSDAEVKVVMLNPTNLIEDCKKCGIKLPSNFERNVAADMIWQKGGKDNRKSFIYYKPAEEDERRPASNSSVNLPPMYEGAPPQPRKSVDPNRFKVQSKTQQDDDIQEDLEDLEQELEQLMREEMKNRRV